MPRFRPRGGAARLPRLLGFRVDARTSRAVEVRHWIWSAQPPGWALRRAVGLARGRRRARASTAPSKPRPARRRLADAWSLRSAPRSRAPVHLGPGGPSTAHRRTARASSSGPRTSSSTRPAPAPDGGPGTFRLRGRAGSRSRSCPALRADVVEQRVDVGERVVGRQALANRSRGAPSSASLRATRRGARRRRPGGSGGGPASPRREAARARAIGRLGSGRRRRLGSAARSRPRSDLRRRVA